MIRRATRYLSGFTSGFWLKLMGGALAASLAFGAVQTVRHALVSADLAKLERDHAKAFADAVRTAREADEQASDRRAADTATNIQAEQDRTDAIDEATDSLPDDANRRLACQRLRAQGITPLPPGC